MISLSLASVLVISENSRRLRPNASPIALAGRLAHRAVPVRQLVERPADGQFLAAHRDAHAGDRLVEQPRPGGAPGHLLLVQQLFQLVGELVRAEHAQVAQPWPPARQRRVGKLGLQRRLVQPVQLQGEEQQVAADRGHPLGHGLVEPADRRVGGIAAEQQLGVRGSRRPSISSIRSYSAIAAASAAPDRPASLPAWAAANAARRPRRGRGRR